MNRVPDPILAMIFGHNLDYHTYSLVCKRWKAVLERFPTEVWRRKIAEALKSINYKFKEFIFIDHPMFKAFNLKPTLKYFVEWIFDRSKVISNDLSIQLGCIRYHHLFQITLDKIGDDNVFVDIYNGNHLLYSVAEWGKVIAAFEFNYLDQYTWSGPVVDAQDELEYLLIPHGVGTAVVDGKIYRNVDAFLGCLGGNKSSYPKMTKKIKKLNKNGLLSCL